MAEPIKMRVREGCRGGREQFKWDSVKDQTFKDREQYLGATTKVGMMGKFGRYYCHDWYNRKRDTAASIETERSQVQAFEEELMQEALGLKPKRLMLAKKPLTEDELKEVLAKERSEGRKGRDLMGPQKHLVRNDFGEEVVASDIVEEAARDASIKGLGFASHRTAKLEEYKAKVLGTEGKLEGAKNPGMPSVVKLEDDADVIKFGDPLKDELVKEEAGEGVKEEPCDVKEELSDGGTEPRTAKRMRREERARSAEGDRAGSEGRIRRKAAKKEKKERKKAEKKMKKKEKKAKKAAKKAEKVAKAAKRRSSSSSSSSS